MKQILLSLLRNLTKKYRLHRARKQALKWEYPNMKHLKLLPLTKHEKNEIQEVWGKLGLKPHYLFYKMFKTIDSFNPLYLSDDLYYPLIIRTLNRENYSKPFAHKGHFAILFNGIKKPTTICLCNRGVLYNKNFEIIDSQRAIDILSNVGSFIIKPTMDSACGRNVNLVREGEDISAIVQQYGDNWIAQEVLEQSYETQKFNPTSLNSFRITTLFINGTCSTQSIVFKIGGNGSVVDNLGAGGIMLGVNKNGEFRDFGYNNKYTKFYSSPSGERFKGTVIAEMPEMCKKMEEYHRRYFASMGIVGWDVALSKEKEFIVIEANLNFPGILFEQLAISTPIFGERTKEVIDYVCLNKSEI